MDLEFLIGYIKLRIFCLLFNYCFTPLCLRFAGQLQCLLSNSALQFESVQSLVLRWIIYIFIFSMKSNYDPFTLFFFLKHFFDFYILLLTAFIPFKYLPVTFVGRDHRKYKWGSKQVWEEILWKVGGITGALAATMQDTNAHCLFRHSKEHNVCSLKCFHWGPAPWPGG